LATAPDLTGVQAGEGVDVLLASVIEDVVALTAYDERRLAAVEQCLVWWHVHPHVVADSLLIRSASPGDILSHRVPQLCFCFSSERYMKSSVSTTASIERSSSLTNSIRCRSDAQTISTRRSNEPAVTTRQSISSQSRSRTATAEMSPRTVSPRSACRPE